MPADLRASGSAQGGHAALTIAPDHPAFDGHFPGRPILPGVMFVAEVLEALLANEPQAIGPAPRLSNVKFLSPCLPGDVLHIEWQVTERRMPFEVRRESDGVVLASGQFER